MSIEKLNTEYVQPGQNPFDLAIQYCGAVDKVIDLSKLNGWDFEFSPAAGTAFLVKETRNVTVDFYMKNNITVASGTEVIVSGGIGYMAVGIDFIVSGMPGSRGVGNMAVGVDFIVN